MEASPLDRIQIIIMLGMVIAIIVLIAAGAYRCLLEMGLGALALIGYKIGFFEDTCIGFIICFVIIRIYSILMCFFRHLIWFLQIAGLLVLLCLTTLFFAVEAPVDKIVEYYCTSTRGFQNPHCIKSCIGERGKSDPQCNVDCLSYCSSENGRNDTNCIKPFSKEVAIRFTPEFRKAQDASTGQSWYNCDYCCYYACFFFTLILIVAACAYAAMNKKRAATLPSTSSAGFGTRITPKTSTTPTTTTTATTATTTTSAIATATETAVSPKDSSANSKEASQTTPSSPTTNLFCGADEEDGGTMGEKKRKGEYSRSSPERKKQNTDDTV